MIPIGRPVANVQVYILDRRQQPVPISHLRRRIHVHTTNMEVLKEFRPRPFGGRITLFEATEGTQPTDNGWDLLAAGGVTRFTIPGDHYSMMRQPDGEIPGERLKSLLVERAAGFRTVQPQSAVKATGD